MKRLKVLRGQRPIGAAAEKGEEEMEVKRAIVVIVDRKEERGLRKMGEIFWLEGDFSVASDGG